jgi:hypothetical protein
VSGTGEQQPLLTSDNMIWNRTLRIRIKAVLLLVSLLVSGCVYVTDTQAAPNNPENIKGSLNLDINFPGAGVRCFLSGAAALELRGQYEKNSAIGGARLYLFPGLFRKAGVVPYIGVEGDYGVFKGKYSKGHGYAGGGFAGLEYFLGKSLSAQMDAGASYLALKDADTALVQSGLEFVLNFGVNLYLK